MVTEINPDFFATAAQVVPLLAIAGLMEDRKGWDEAPSRSDPVIRLVFVLSLLAAEVAALTALAGRPTPAERQFVIMGLCVGGLALVIRFVGHEFESFYAGISNRWIRVIVFGVWWIAVMALLLVPLFAAALDML